MSLRTAFYNQLAADQFLQNTLARSTIEGAETEPAIYETWPAENTPMPYLVYRFDFSEADHFAKRQGSLNLDIFVANHDTITAEEIDRQIQKILDRRRLYSEQDGEIRFYNQGTADNLEDYEDIVHYFVSYTAIHWRKDLIENLEERDD